MFGSRRYERALLRSDERFERFWRESEERYRNEVQITREVIRRNELAFKQAFRVMSDLVEESQAQRRALFQILDRLENGGGATAQ